MKDLALSDTMTMTTLTRIQYLIDFIATQRGFLIEEIYHPHKNSKEIVENYKDCIEGAKRDLRELTYNFQ